MKKVLFIGLVWPEPTSSAAGWRILQLIRLFQSQFEVLFASAAAKSLHSQDLVALGVSEHTIALNDASFDEFIGRLNPDIVVFDRFMSEEQYGWRVMRHCPQAIRILDTEDLHFLRAARLKSYKTQQPIDIYNETALREIAAIYRSDLSLLISEVELELLTRTFRVDPTLLQYVPFLENPLQQESIERLPTFEDRRDFVFIGNFLHEPNWRTVEILKKDIWPRLCKVVPDAALHVYGAYVPQKAIQLHKPQENFHIKGRADDARMTLQNYRVLLAPIPAGAGTKGKFVDAMHSGTPTVSSSVGAEAMTANGAWNGFIADDPAEFIEKAASLYRDERTWIQAQSVGFDLFNELFADPIYAENLLSRCVELSETLSQHRRDNFIGQMLNHHTTQSTKYMSLWIEEKNKNAD